MGSKASWDCITPLYSPLTDSKGELTRSAERKCEHKCFIAELNCELSDRSPVLLCGIFWCPVSLSLREKQLAVSLFYCRWCSGTCWLLHPTAVNKWRKTNSVGKRIQDLLTCLCHWDLFFFLPQPSPHLLFPFTFFFFFGGGSYISFTNSSQTTLSYNNSHHSNIVFRDTFFSTLTFFFFYPRLKNTEKQPLFNIVQDPERETAGNEWVSPVHCLPELHHSW